MYLIKSTNENGEVEYRVYWTNGQFYWSYETEEEANEVVRKYNEEGRYEVDPSEELKIDPDYKLCEPHWFGWSNQ